MLNKNCFFLIILLIILTPIVLATDAYANGGGWRIEPEPAIHAIPLKSEDVHILSEELIFDLTITDRAFLGHITAKYFLKNASEEEQTISIAFPRAGARRDEIKDSDHHEYVKLDDENMEWDLIRYLDFYFENSDYHEITFKDILSSMVKAMELEESDEITLGGRYDVMLFEVTLKPRTIHELEVSYYQFPGMDRTQTWQFTYIYQYFLEPAKYWASFKDLKISIKLPEGYHLTKSNLKFNKNEEGIYEYFGATLPEENLEFHVYHQSLFVSKALYYSRYVIALSILFAFIGYMMYKGKDDEIDSNVK